VSALSSPTQRPHENAAAAWNITHPPSSCGLGCRYKIGAPRPSCSPTHESPSHRRHSEVTSRSNPSRRERERLSPLPTFTSVGARVLETSPSSVGDRMDRVPLLPRRDRQSGELEFLTGGGSAPPQRRACGRGPRHRRYSVSCCALGL
jgi:hypothetical protein